MAKKKYEEQVYPAAPLKIAREAFCDLLSKQIERGNELLGIDVPKKARPTTNYTGYVNMHKPGTGVKYDETAQNDYFAKFTRWHERNKEIYRSSFTVENSIYFHDYETQIYPRLVIEDIIKEYKEDINRLMNQMQADIERVDLMKCDVHEDKALTVEPKKLSQDIFIVHGHNEEMKQTVARVVGQLGLKPIILHEQPNGGKTIIEKFESNAESINFAIILLSADDLAASVRDLNKVKDEELRQQMEKRARQNVVFEMGYFAGKLGRANVFFLLQDGVSKPGDLDGIVYTAYDAAHAWRFELVKELKNAGYKVSADQIL